MSKLLDRGMVIYGTEVPDLSKHSGDDTPAVWCLRGYCLCAPHGGLDKQLHSKRVKAVRKKGGERLTGSCF